MAYTNADSLISKRLVITVVAIPKQAGRVHCGESSEDVSIHWEIYIDCGGEAETMQWEDDYDSREE